MVAFVEASRRTDRLGQAANNVARTCPSLPVRREHAHRSSSRNLPEAEEVPDFLLGGLVRDTLDVNGVASGRHDCCVFEGGVLVSEVLLLRSEYVRW
jgi:hypothetical protein